MLKVSWAQAAAWRVHRNYLDQRAPARSMLAVASRLCGLQAQLMSSAELALWARVEGISRARIQQALWKQRTLVKTWAMRGTLHLLPADEMPLWHAALKINPRYLRAAAWQKYFGISLEELDLLTKTIGRALEGRVLTREELMQEVGELMGSASFGPKIIGESSWGVVLKPAAFTGLLCFGPSVGQRVRFTHPETWVQRRQQALDPESVPAEVARRFLSAYGPATHQDFARWWNGGGTVVARQWIAALGDEVSSVDLAGTKAWILTEHAGALGEAKLTRSVRLLPAFDQYVIAASCHAEQLLPGVARSRVYRSQGWISPVLLVNGRMEGVWRHEVKGSRVEVAIEPFIKTPAWVRRAATEEAERLAAFLDCKLSVTWNI